MKRVILIILFAAAFVVGCHGPQKSRRVEGATAASVTARHFAPPTFVVGGRGVVCAVASRPQSDLSLRTARIRISPDRQVSVDVTSYQYVSSDWATLGPVFDQGRSRKEATEIREEICSRLKME